MTALLARFAFEKRGISLWTISGQYAATGDRVGCTDIHGNPAGPAICATASDSDTTVSFPQFRLITEGKLRT